MEWSTNPYCIAINNSRVTINNEMDDVTTNGVLDHLMVDVLRQDQYDELASFTDIDRTRRLVDMLVLHRDVRGAFNVFCLALENESKASLADTLRAELCEQLVAAEQRPAVDGGDVCGHVLSANRPAIESTIHDIITILDQLQNDEAFNNEQCALLKAFTSLSDRRRHLVNMVISLAGRPGVFESFCTGLVMDENAGLADLLKAQCQQRGRQPAPAGPLPPVPPPSFEKWMDIASIRLRQVTHRDLQLLARLLTTADRFNALGKELGFTDSQMEEFRLFAPHAVELQVLQMLFAWLNREKRKLRDIVGILVPPFLKSGLDHDEIKKIFCRATP